MNVTFLGSFRVISAKLIFAAVLGFLSLATSAYAQAPVSREIGCFPDNRNADDLGTRGRDLDGAAFKDPSMTVKQCLRLCSDQGFKYAGLQNGSWCFCGNSYGRHKAGAASCTTKCAGDQKQICGGEWANSVWELLESHAAPQPAAPTEQLPLTGPQLAAQLQRVLKNIDCYTKAVDGDWGRGSRAALQRFNAIAGTNFSTDVPTMEALETVASWGGSNCKLVTKRKTPRKTKKAKTYRKKKPLSGGSSIDIIIRGPGGAGIRF